MIGRPNIKETIECGTTTDLSDRLALASAEVSVAHQILLEARNRLAEVEARVKRSWKKRNAAVDSVKMTAAAQRRCGLARNRSAQVSLSRHQSRINDASREIHEIVESGASICTDLYSAWDLYNSARILEKLALEAIVATQAAHPSDEAVVESHRNEARAHLRKLEPVRKKEQIERIRELTLDSDGRFDPNYSELELLLRRMRPWV